MADHSRIVTRVVDGTVIEAFSEMAGLFPKMRVRLQFVGIDRWLDIRDDATKKFLAAAKIGSKHLVSHALFNSANFNVQFIRGTKEPRKGFFGVCDELTFSYSNSDDPNRLSDVDIVRIVSLVEKYFTAIPILDAADDSASPSQLSALQAPVDLLASALLGSAAKVKLHTPMADVEIDGKQLRKAELPR